VHPPHHRPHRRRSSVLLRGRTAILDGEIVVLDDSGLPSFQRRRRRLVTRSRTTINAIPATLLLFDILYLDGTDVTRQPYVERRGLLETLRLDQTRLVVPPS
jgi:bifunctional non-homologous end joining protein LigD